MLTQFSDIQEAYRDETTIALDLETTGLSAWNDNIAVIGMYGPTSGTPSLLHYPRGVEVPREVITWLESFDEIITHNGTQFDILFLANAGMDWTKVTWYDTLIGEQSVIAVNRRDVRVNLQDTVKRRLGKVLDKSIDHRSWQNDVLTQEQLDYIAGDIVHLYNLREAQLTKAAEDSSGNMMRALEFEQSLIPAVLSMELNGLPINVAKLESYVEASLDIQGTEEDWLRERWEFDGNLNSPTQLKKLLNDRYPDMFPNTQAGLLMEYTRMGGQLGEEMQHLLNYRHAAQRKKMFSQSWMDSYIVYHKDGVPRVHGKFWQIGTDTGRFSSSQPNLQQIPRDGREMFGPMPGSDLIIGASDYAAIEVRVAAALSADQAMIEAFNNGEDIHTLVASESFDVPRDQVTYEQRRIAKAISFTFLFGGGLETFLAYAASNGSELDRDMGREAMDRFFERFHGIADMKRQADYRCSTGRPLPIVYPTGLKRMLIGADLRSSVFLNNVVQGTAAAGLKMALKLIYDRGYAGYLCAVVHDEVVYAAPEAEIEEVQKVVEDCMIEGMFEALTDAEPIAIAVESSVGDSWAGNPETEKLVSRLPESLVESI